MRKTTLWCAQYNKIAEYRCRLKLKFNKRVKVIINHLEKKWRAALPLNHTFILLPFESNLKDACTWSKDDNVTIKQIQSLLRPAGIVKLCYAIRALPSSHTASLSAPNLMSSESLCQFDAVTSTSPTSAQHENSQFSIVQHSTSCSVAASVANDLMTSLHHTSSLPSFHVELHTGRGENETPTSMAEEMGGIPSSFMQLAAIASSPCPAKSSEVDIDTDMDSSTREGRNHHHNHSSAAIPDGGQSLDMIAAQAVLLKLGAKIDTSNNNHNATATTTSSPTITTNGPADSENSAETSEVHPSRGRGLEPSMDGFEFSKDDTDTQYYRKFQL